MGLIIKIHYRNSLSRFRRRKGWLASGVMQTLAKIRGSNSIAVDTKMRVYETLVLSLLLYNGETWTLKEEAKQGLLVFEMACLRRITGVSRRQHIRNTAIRGIVGGGDDVVQRLLQEGSNI